MRDCSQVLSGFYNFTDQFFTGFMKQYQRNLFLIMLTGAILFCQRVFAQEGTYYFNDSTIVGKGKIVNKLKEGVWTFYNKPTGVTETGSYENNILANVALRSIAGCYDFFLELAQSSFVYECQMK